MAVETHIHAGSGTWRQLVEFHIHAGSGTWRNLSEAWSHAGGGTWHKIFEVAGCACGTANIDATAQNYDPSGCTCQTTPKVILQSKRCIKWNYTADDLACQKAQIQYNVSGGSYTTIATLYELNRSSATAGSPCSGSAHEGYYSTGFRCVNDNRQYRVRAVLTDLTVCDTGVLQNTTNCIV